MTRTPDDSAPRPAGTAGKVFIRTHGCQMNEYDSARMADLLRASHGLEPTDDPAEADLLLLNTCSIREKAQEKVFSELGRWRALKQARPGVLIGVGGCVASQEGEAIRTRAPFVDVVFGPQTLHRLPALLDARRRARRGDLALVDVSFPEVEKFDHLPPPRVDGPVASVSVMEGCSKYCTFCVVPYTRGEEVSRPPQDILDEVRQLAGQGVREVTLLGQNVNAWRGPLEAGGGMDFAELVTLVAEVDGIARIRFTTSHPVEFSDALIQAFADVPQLCSQVHLPVQSGSDRILAAMKRGHTALEYRARVRRLREARPDIAISSDFIVGFPGETDADFDRTLALVDQVRFDGAFCFLYSPRPGTPAAALPNDTPLPVREQRLARLLERIGALQHEHARAMVGRDEVVLVTGPARRGSGDRCGRTSTNRVVNFACDDPALDGTLVRVHIDSVWSNSLRGSLLGPAGRQVA